MATWHRDRERGEWRKFGILFGILFGLVSGWCLWKGKEVFTGFALVAVLFFLCALLLPSLLRIPCGIWSGFANALGRFNTRLLLSLLYYLVLTPVGVASRLCGKKFLDLEMETTKNTYWKKNVAKEWDPVRYERQF